MGQIKHKLQQLPWLYQLIKRGAGVISKERAPGDRFSVFFDRYVRELKKTTKEPLIVQFGANDGGGSDPVFGLIKRYRLKGILVEPVPHLFKKLQAVYAGQPQVLLENVAVGTEDGEASFFRVQDTGNCDLPPWYDQIGSFNKEVVLRHWQHIPKIKELIVEDRVAKVSFQSLMEKYRIRTIDILQIDVEGFDYEIIKTIDFERYSVGLVQYEHKHLESGDQDACLHLLSKSGFTCYEMTGDTICLHQNTGKAAHKLLNDFIHGIGQ